MTHHTMNIPSTTELISLFHKPEFAMENGISVLLLL